MSAPPTGVTDGLRLGPGVQAALERHALERAPEECCGALLGREGEVLRALPLENDAPDRRRAFRLSAREYLRAEREADAAGLRLLGFYHSHPAGPAVPSPADAASAWPEFWTVVVPIALGTVGAPRAWRFDAGSRRFSEAPLR